MEGAVFTWGDEPFSDERPQANIWQGDFPHKNIKANGYLRTGPVKSFPKNGYGLYDMSGNIGAVAALVLSAIGLGTGFLPVAALWMVPAAAVAASYLESILGAAVKRGPLAQNEILNLLNTAVGAILAGGLFWMVGATS